MLIFHTPAAEDKGWIDPILASSPTRACEYHFTTIYLWGSHLHKAVARVGDRLVMRLFQGEQVRYLFPAGSGPLEPAIWAMEEDARACGVPLRMICLPQEFREELETAMPGQFSFRENRNTADYLYRVDKLADLSGRKLHGKRNHIHRFDDKFPDWMFEPLTEGNAAECVAMEQEWYTKRMEELDPVQRENLRHETAAVQEALGRFRELGLEGGLIRGEGRVLAFALGSPLGEDCFDIHFEKAFGDIQGAYTVITREMARHVRRRYPQVVWLNRGEDMGVEGLRKAKLSYYPDELLTKYSAYLI